MALLPPMEPNEPQTLNARGEWVPSIPEPWWLGWRQMKPRCPECGEDFRRPITYRGHYALVHILGLS